MEIEDVNMKHVLDGDGLKVLWDIIETNFALKKDSGSGFLTDAEIDDICGEGGGIRPGGNYVTMQVVDVLPTTGMKSVIYLVPNGATTGNDIYDEYVWNDSKWEKVGSGSGTIDSIPEETIKNLF